MNEVPAAPHVKPGFLTSEFWLHVLASAPAVLAVIPGVPQAVVIVLAAVSNLSAAMYSRGRADLKGKALDIVAAAVEAAARKAAE